MICGLSYEACRDPELGLRRLEFGQQPLCLEGEDEPINRRRDNFRQVGAVFLTHCFGRPGGAWRQDELFRRRRRILDEPAGIRSYARSFWPSAEPDDNFQTRLDAYLALSEEDRKSFPETEIRRLQLESELRRVEAHDEELTTVAFRHRAKRWTWYEAGLIFLPRVIIGSVLALLFGATSGFSWLLVLGLTALSTQLRMARLDAQHVTDLVIDCEIARKRDGNRELRKEDLEREYFPKRFRTGDREVRCTTEWHVSDWWNRARP